MNLFRIKQGDRTPLIAKLYKDGALADLTAATSVIFRFREVGETGDPTEVECTVAGTGTVAVPWGEGDTGMKGKYIGEFVVVFPGGPQLYPSEGFQHFEIIDSLEPAP